MSDLRTAAQQVLDAIESDTMLFSAWTGKMIAARTALRAALAQQDEPEGSVCARCGALAFDPLAALVAAAEREACARVVEDVEPSLSPIINMANRLAAAVIRARGRQQ